MRGSGFWGLLGDIDRERLTAAARPRVFAGDAVLCTEGEPTTHLFILLAGWVKVMTVTHEGQEIVEALRGDGDIVGEIAGQVTGYRTATVQAIGTVRTLIIGSAQFEVFLDAHPGASHAYRRAMAEHRQAAAEYQRSQVLSSGAQRLARLLLDLAERPGPPSQQAGPAPFELSQEELASLVGASRSTVTRALQDWRARHVIATAQRRITILDRPQLLRIAGRPPREPLSASGRRLPVQGPPHECRPLSRRECEYGAKWVTRVPHQHRRTCTGDFNAGPAAAASTAFAPARGGGPTRPIKHETSFRSVGARSAAATRMRGVVPREAVKS